MRTKDQPQFSAVMKGIAWQYTTHPAIRYAHADRPGGVLTHDEPAGGRGDQVLVLKGEEISKRKSPK